MNRTHLNTREQQEVLEYLDGPEQDWLRQTACQLVTPMMAKNQVIGLILLGYDPPSPLPGRRDTDLLMELADQASLAFQNAALYREQQERLVRLHRADRLATIGRLAAGVAHEVRNPLTAIRSTMQYLSTSLDATHKELVCDLIDEVDRIDRTISGLLHLSRSGRLRREEVDLAELIDQSLRLLEARARRQGVRLVAEVESGLAVEADSAQMKQVFLNLVLNVLHALEPEGGTVRLEARAADARPGGAGPEIAIAVHDDGPGIPADLIVQVGDPFVTTKPDGTGLGLSICYGILEQHGGRLEIESQVGVGTSVKMLLPRVGPRARDSVIAESGPAAFEPGNETKDADCTGNSTDEGAGDGTEEPDDNAAGETVTRRERTGHGTGRRPDDRPPSLGATELGSLATLVLQP